MGLCSGHCDWHETLFPHLVNLYVSSEEEGRRLWESVESQPNIVEVIVKAMSDGIRTGQVIIYSGRYQGYAGNFFRGENAYNTQCHPSLFVSCQKICTRQSCMPADISNMNRAANIPQLRLTSLKLIGFQSFMRCSNQSAYIIAGGPFDLYKD